MFKIIYNMDKAKDKQDRQTGRQTDGGHTDWQKHMREKEEKVGGDIGKICLT